MSTVACVSDDSSQRLGQPDISAEGFSPDPWQYDDPNGPDMGHGGPIGPSEGPTSGIPPEGGKPAEEPGGDDGGDDTDGPSGPGYNLPGDGPNDEAAKWGECFSVTYDGVALCEDQYCCQLADCCEEPQMDDDEGDEDDDELPGEIDPSDSDIDDGPG